MKYVLQGSLTELHLDRSPDYQHQHPIYSQPSGSAASSIQTFNIPFDILRYLLCGKHKDTKEPGRESSDWNNSS